MTEQLDTQQLHIQGLKMDRAAVSEYISLYVDSNVKFMEHSVGHGPCVYHRNLSCQLSIIGPTE